MTKVIFRKFQDGEVLALFPEIAGDTNPSNCLSYAHIGQHGASSLYPDNTKPAWHSEYKPLLDELAAIGYDYLRVYHRTNRNDYMKRVEALRRI